MPDQASLIPLLEEGLPEYWSVDDLTIVAASQAGTVQEPTALVRFEATVFPESDLLVESVREGPFVGLSVSVNEDDVRTVYGVFNLTYFAGAWSGAPSIENPVEGLGQPLERFTQPVVVLGSPEADAAIAQVRSGVLKQAEADLQAALAGARSDHEEQLVKLRADHQARIDKAEAELAAGLSAAQAKLTAEIEALEASAKHSLDERARVESERSGQLEAARNETASEIAEIRRLAEAEAADLQAAHAAALADLQAAHAKAVADLQAAQATELADLQAAFDQKVAETNARLAEQEATLQTQWQATEQKLSQLQTDLASLQAETDGLATDYAARFEELQENRRKFLDRFVGETWKGSVTCTEVSPEVGNEPDVESAAIYINVVETNTVGFSAWVWHRFRRERPDDPAWFEFQMVEEEAAFPLQLRAVSSGKTQWPNLNLPIRDFKFVIAESGKMRGTSQVTTMLDYDCVIEVGR